MKTIQQSTVKLAFKGVVVLGLLLVGLSFPAFSQDLDWVKKEGDAKDENGASRVPDTYIPMQEDAVFERPLTLELGNPFLGRGENYEGFELPTGAVWHPSFLAFGTLRSGLQSFDNGLGTRSEWANRLDLFGNLQLSGTERILFGFRPLDKDGQFTGYNFHPSTDDGYQDEFNLRVSNLFFEGDIGEIFPNLDPDDFDILDIGFSIGRQGLLIQEGIMINDRLDGLGIVKNTLLPWDASNWRIMGFYGWNEVGRRTRVNGVPTRNSRDPRAHLFGIFNEFDFPFSTMTLDAAVVISEGDITADGFFAGIGGTQRIGAFNTDFRINLSSPIGAQRNETEFGTLFFAQVSTTPHWPHHTDNILYLNAFLGIEEYSSAARDDAVGGPLGRTGILFAAVGLGRYGAPLGNDADNAVGAALGYQWFLDKEKQSQLIFELGGRDQTKNVRGSGAAAFGVRYQKAFHHGNFHWLLIVDGFVGAQESRDTLNGGRIEAQFKF